MGIEWVCMHNSNNILLNNIPIITVQSGTCSITQVAIYTDADQQPFAISLYAFNKLVVGCLDSGVHQLQPCVFYSYCDSSCKIARNA